uniref:Small nuclear ribonucleoprotein Sm D3 n=1 Tax=Prasinoderma coloniale TaxID=156133 RepID=A0A7R9Y0T4_9VIRI
MPSIGVPVKMLHEAEGHVVTCELKSGEAYRGTLIEAEDNWNVQIGTASCTHRDGRITQLEHVFIRGSKIRWLVIPDMLKNAPLFKKTAPKAKAAKGAAAAKK